MEKSNSLFFIALLPPGHIQEYANQIKQYFADNYNSRHGQKSPPHITLQPPFEWANDNVSVLEENLKKFATGRELVPITLNNFAAFPPRVIYIDVVKTAELMKLQTDLIAYLESNLEITDKIGKNRGFTPHMTVAFKDLTRQNFKLAWSEFKNRSLHFDFTLGNITLLLHDGKRWNIKSEFVFTFD